MEKVSNENKSKDDSTVNNPIAANESSNVIICPVAGITVTTNAAISTDTGTEELEKVSNENKCKDDSTMNNPVAANERSNVIRPAADITVTTNAGRSTDTATTASATMLTTVAAPTTADATALAEQVMCRRGYGHSFSRTCRFVRIDSPLLGMWTEGTLLTFLWKQSCHFIERLSIAYWMPSLQQKYYISRLGEWDALYLPYMHQNCGG